MVIKSPEQEARAGDLYQEIDQDGNLLDNYLRVMVDGALPKTRDPEHHWKLVQRSYDRDE
ncbi:hypothetical protein [Dongshaea marina]|uniref:hypothetical protein n=1 Tax=Dongshaea marina TaxID=2047966 RepID=UPI000D3EA702|nr:hypothetical protein [Dongshaea marina]